jgi:1-deoxyxylulose-5-phosphate synthase
MNTISRRKFIKTSVAGATAASTILFPGQKKSYAAKEKIDMVDLGKSGIKVSRIAWGTGTRGTKHSSRQTKIGVKEFYKITDHAYECGINFFDSADQYGTHTYFRSALKNYPRDKIVVLTKIWTNPSDWMKTMPVSRFLEISLKELRMDYIDIVLLHCMTSANWPIEKDTFCNDLARAKQKGIIRAHGVSCHSLPALQAAAKSEWADVIFARFNNSGDYMDHYPQTVAPVLKAAKKRGAGVVGMKIFGNGKLVSEKQRQSSLDFVLKSNAINAMTIGFETTEQITDTIKRVNKIVKG